MSGKAVLLVGGLLFPFIIGFFASFFYPGGFAMAQAADRSAGNFWSIVLLAIVMIIGIFSSFVFEKAKKSHQDGTRLAWSLIAIATDFQFIAALFVAPLIFNSVYALTKQNPETLGDYLLAYQNGFFWQTVLAGVTGGMSTNVHRSKSSVTPKSNR